VVRGGAAGPAGGFFTAAEAARIAKVPRTTVDYWARTGLVEPSQRRERPRLYAFADLRDLVTVRRLRDAGALLPKIREALAVIRTVDSSERLAGAELLVVGGNVIYRNRAQGVEPVDVNMGNQRVLAVTMDSIFQELGAPDPLRRELRPRPGVVIDPEVRGGTPVLQGTRIPTQLVAELVDDDMTPADVIALYPALTSERIDAAVAYEHSQRSASAG
jgi:uncharacterized protein (DUF433 family)/DNA-binding transcriptional MerR regulator